MVRTAIQLGTFRTLSEGLPETIDRVGDTSFEGVEFWGLDGARPSAVADALEANGLDTIGAHVLPLSRLADEYEEVVEMYETIGCRRIVVTEKDQHRDAFESVAEAEELAERISTLADRLADDGFDLLYHNGSVEFGEIGSRRGLDVLAENSDVEFEIDTGLAWYVGADPAALIDEFADRVPVVHLTDSAVGAIATVQLELDAGGVDVEACVAAAYDADVDWLVYEHEQTSDPLGSLRHADSKLTQLCREDPTREIASTD